MWILSSLISMALASSPTAFSARFELGVAQNTKNEFQIPNNSGTAFSLPNNSVPYGRFEGVWNMKPSHALRLVIAPFEIENEITSSTPLLFENQNFAANTPTTVGFKFNSYRLGYLYNFHNSERWTWTLGATLKARDASIYVEQNGVQEKFTDFGFVPLLYLGARYQLSTDWFFHFNLDGAGSPQGRAIDALSEFQYTYREQSQIGIGFRWLDGGADNEKIKNFATIQYWLVSATHFF